MNLTNMENPTIPTKEGFMQKITSSKKKLFGALFVAALVLSVPITIGLVNQQQDIRQQASGWDCTQLLQYYNQYLSNCNGQNASACQIVKAQLETLHCTPTATPSATLAPSATPSATVTPVIGLSPTAAPSATATPSATSTNTPTPTAGPLTIIQRLFDFNDDGKINEVDLNILYTGFTARDGD